MRAWPLLLLLLAVLLPTAVGEEAPERDPCFIFVDASPDFLTVRVRADVGYTEQEKRDLAQRFDTDEDGALDLDETYRLMEETARVIAAPERMGALALYVDGVTPRSVSVVQVPESPLANVSDVAEWGITEVRTYDFPVVPKSDVHVLSGGIYARPLAIPPRPVVETLVVTAPDGWVVWSLGNHTGPPPEGPSLDTVGPSQGTQYGTQRVTRDDLDPDRSYFVVFAKEGVDPYGVRGQGEGFFPIPAPALALALVALTLAALARRR